MIRHTILMPFARLRFAAILREHMRNQQVEWRPLLDGNVLVPLEAPAGDGMEVVGNERRQKRTLGDNEFWKDEADCSWIKPWRCESKAEYNVGHWVCDQFLDAMVEEDKQYMGTMHEASTKAFYSPSHYVTFATDDCLWNDQGLLEIRKAFEPKMPDRGWQAAQQLQSPKVVICGFLAGTNMMPPTYKKIEAWDDWKFNSCRTFATKFEVLTVRADLLREERFGPLWCADGFMVERLCRKYGMTPCYSCLVYVNALRPEQWGFPSSHQR